MNSACQFPPNFPVPTFPVPASMDWRGSGNKDAYLLNRLTLQVFCRLTPFVHHLTANRQDQRTYAYLQELRKAKQFLSSQAKYLPYTSFSELGKLTIDINRRVLDEKIATFKTMIMVEKACAIMKGRVVRRKTVMPWQIVSLLRGHIAADDTRLQAIAQALCRQINEAIKTPASCRADCFPLKEMHNFGLSCWLARSNDAFDLIVKAADQKPFATTEEKDIFYALNFTISLKMEVSPEKILARHKIRRQGQCIPVAIHKLNEKCDEAVFERGIALHERIQRLAQENFFSLTKKLLSANSDEAGQYCQAWYPSDLWDAIQSRSIPVAFTPEPQRAEFNLFHSIQSIIDVGSSIAKWHKIGYIHRDLAPGNILLKVTGKDTFTAAATDFETVQRPGIGYCSTTSENSYRYWDSHSHRGLATYFTDIYALTMCLLKSIIPEPTPSDQNWIYSVEARQELLARAVDNMVSVGYDPDKYSPDSYIDMIKSKLSSTVNTYQYPHAQSASKKISAMIKGAKQIIALAAKMIEIDQKLSKVFSDTVDPILQSIQQNRSIRSRSKLSDLMAMEIEQLVNHYPFFAATISSKIADWKEMDGIDKLQIAEALIDEELANDYLDPECRRQWKEILEKVETRKSVVTFISQILIYNREDQLHHPLYMALKEPMELNDQEIEGQINKEIQKLLLTQGNIPIVRSRKIVEGLNADLAGPQDIKAKREAIKQMLQNSISNPRESIQIQSQCKTILDQITTIENGMAFVVERRDVYRQKADEVTQFVAREMGIQPGMPIMEAFIEQVSAIQTKMKNS